MHGELHLAPLTWLPSSEPFPSPVAFASTFRAHRPAPPPLLCDFVAQYHIPKSFEAFGTSTFLGGKKAPKDFH